MVDIFDRTEIRKISTNFLSEIQKHPEFDHFWGCTFNTTPSFIQEKLLPHFKKIDLIIGLTGTEAHQALANHINSVNTATEILEDDKLKELVDRIQDEDCVLRYTKDQMIHTKLYVFTSSMSDEYRAYVGSMNLSDQALRQNREMLICDHGLKSDKLFQTIYQPMMEDLWQDSTTYLDAKMVRSFQSAPDIESKRKVVTTELIGKLLPQTEEKADENGEMHRAVIGPEISLPVKEIIETKQVLKKPVNPHLEQDRKDNLNVINALYDPKGHPQTVKTLSDEKYSTQLVHVLFHEVDPDNSNVVILQSPQERFPKPIYIYDKDGGTLTKANAYDSEYRVAAVGPVPPKDKIQMIEEIVKFYGEVKQRDESKATFSFLMYVLESANIWRIRELVWKMGSKARLGDIPVVCALVGQGGTGKTTLLEIAEGLTSGNHNNIIQAGDDEFWIKESAKKEARSGKRITGDPKSNSFQVNNNNLWGLADTYMQTDGPVTPMLIDDPIPTFITSSKGEQALKKYTNTCSGNPHPVLLVALNSQDKNVSFSVNAQTNRRAYLISQENQFKDRNKEQLKFTNYIQKDLTPDLFQYLTQQIDAYLQQVEEENNIDEFNKIDKDFLYPVKKIFKELLISQDLLDPYMEQYLDAENYNFKDDAGCRNWHALLSDKGVIEKITFSKEDDRPLAFVPRDAFPGNSSNKINQYFDYIPPKMNICATRQDAGLYIDIENMCKWLDDERLVKLYEDDQGITKRKERKEYFDDFAENFASAVVQAQEKQREQKRKNSFLYKLTHRE